MSTKRKASKRTPRAARRGPDKGGLEREQGITREELYAHAMRDAAGHPLTRTAKLPGIVYVWNDNEGTNGVRDLLVDTTLPEDVPSGRIVGVYHLVDVGELKVTRELKR